MTNEEAIKIIKDRSFCCIECIDCNEECCKALDMAIFALSVFDNWSKCESKEKIPYDKNMRLINSRQIVYSWTTDLNGKEHDGITLESIINKMPTVDVSALSKTPSETEIRTEESAEYFKKSEVFEMLAKINKAVEDGEGYQLKEWIDYVEELPTYPQATITQNLIDEVTDYIFEYPNNEFVTDDEYEMIKYIAHRVSYILSEKAEQTAEEPIKHFGSIECPNCGRLLMLEEQTYGWCKGCKEYDTEKHCCHRYSSFIRESLQDSINAVLEDIKAEIDKFPRIKAGNSNSPTVKYCIDERLLYEILEKMKGE